MAKPSQPDASPPGVYASSFLVHSFENGVTKIVFMDGQNVVASVVMVRSDELELARVLAMISQQREEMESKRKGTVN